MKKFIPATYLFLWASLITRCAVLESYQAAQQTEQEPRPYNKANKQPLVFPDINMDNYYKLQTQKESNADTIYLLNPSFEDVPRCCEPPRGWYNCGPEGETAPDIQPGAFEIFAPAKEGQTYVSLVSRDNDTYEALGQRIGQSLKKGETYQFSFWLMQTEHLISLSRVTGETVNYAAPIKVLAYGGIGFCDKQQFLFETPTVAHRDWKEYVFEFTAEEDFQFIKFVVDTAAPLAENGHICIDHCSAFTRVQKN